MHALESQSSDVRSPRLPVSAPVATSFLPDPVPSAHTAALPSRSFTGPRLVFVPLTLFPQIRCAQDAEGSQIIQLVSELPERRGSDEKTNPGEPAARSCVDNAATDPTPCERIRKNVMQCASGTFKCIRAVLQHDLVQLIALVDSGAVGQVSYLTPLKTLHERRIFPTSRGVGADGLEGDARLIQATTLFNGLVDDDVHVHGALRWQSDLQTGEVMGEPGANTGVLSLLSAAQLE
ncbi:hypothetical protein BDK51DRAFT_44287 [Blyttiomyces helicus]|uniref:Uncharacterized protein n=1 Tax=Blyttiomyces helicus TaxID=388810 RepID=A0A4V1IRR7_9FUNG|nr:hypothetical protein BDK51DRAFT_44287 [Blyttiomyces helicus]|eukprot:RKO90997.1 hypothetical protein BDK51DRAFT_44287 [Blyttiomyces helicus]